MLFILLGLLINYWIHSVSQTPLSRAPGSLEMEKFNSWEPKGCPVQIHFPEQTCLGGAMQWESELVGKNSHELQWHWWKFSCFHELSRFWRLNKSDLIIRPFHTPLNISKLLHSSLNTWPNDIPFALLKSASLSQLSQQQKFPLPVAKTSLSFQTYFLVGIFWTIVACRAPKCSWQPPCYLSLLSSCWSLHPALPRHLGRCPMLYLLCELSQQQSPGCQGSGAVPAPAPCGGCREGLSASGASLVLAEPVWEPLRSEQAGSVQCRARGHPCSPGAHRALGISQDQKKHPLPYLEIGCSRIFLSQLFSQLVVQILPCCENMWTLYIFSIGHR